jgi:hypothetical protein
VKPYKNENIADCKVSIIELENSELCFIWVWNCHNDAEIEDIVKKKCKCWLQQKKE